MWIDIAAIVLLVIFTLLGYARGLFSQAWSLGSLIAAFVGARPLYTFLHGRFGLGSDDSLLGAWLVQLLVGVALYVVLLVLGYLLEKALVERFKIISAGNRVLGGLVGLVKGTAGVVVALWLIGFIALMSPSRSSPWREQLAQSQTATWTAPYNPLNLFLLARVRPYLPRSATGSSREPVTPPSSVAERSSFKALLSDQAFLEAYRERAYFQILLNPSFQRLVLDTELMQQLERSRH